MTWWQWVLVGVGVYLVLAGVTGLVLGAVIRNRNRQAPQEDDQPDGPRIPEQRSGPRRRARPQQWPPWNHHRKDKL